MTIKLSRDKPCLLGLDRCHIKNYERVLDHELRKKRGKQSWVASNTGMASVIPAWKITEVLGSEDLTLQREKLYKIAIERRT